MTCELVNCLIKAEFIAVCIVLFTWALGLCPARFKNIERCHLILVDVVILTLTPLLSILIILWTRGYLI